MNDHNPIRDDNLRLVLAADHDAWLNTERNRARWEVVQGIVAVVLFGSWLALATIHYFGDAISAKDTSCIIPGEGQTVEDLPPEWRAQACPSDITPEEQQTSFLTQALGWAAAIMTFLSLIGFPVSLGETLKRLRRLADLRNWTDDHDAFLKKYGRR